MSFPYGPGFDSLLSRPTRTAAEACVRTVWLIASGSVLPAEANRTFSPVHRKRRGGGTWRRIGLL
jgi:hypothetical protein